MSINEIYKPVETDFEQVNTLIYQRLSSDVPLVGKIAEYIISSGGKRIRPLITLLLCRALGHESQKEITLAAVIEFLHTATLLHDDVVDTSDMRRGKSTANAKWGNAPSVLVGDFLYARAFQMLVELESFDIMRIMADTTKIIAEGEVQQLTNCKNPDITEAQYYQVIQGKTAQLFAAATECAAILSDCDQETCKRFQELGNNLGLAFQLVDDVLDYTGDAATMGKNVGDDLAEGKPTLPLIYAMQNASNEDASLIRTAIRKGSTENLEQICKIVESSGAIEYTMEAARKCQTSALNTVSQLPDSEFKEGITALINLAVSRNH